MNVFINYKGGFFFKLLVHFTVRFLFIFRFAFDHCIAPIVNFFVVSAERGNKTIINLLCILFGRLKSTLSPQTKSRE